MRRIKQGWRLTGKSWRMLRSNPSLARFPLFGALASLIPLAATIVGIYLIDTDSEAAGIPVAIVGLYFSAFAIIFFGVALVAAAERAFQGQEAPIGEALALARERLGAVAGWALVSTVIGLILRALESQGSLGQIAAGLAGAAWSLVTFLAIPVIALEGTGPFATIKRSASLFKSRWGEQITGNVTIGAAVLLFGILPGALLIGAGLVWWIGDGEGASVAAGGVLVAIGIVVVVISALVQRSLTGIFGLALYRYVAGGEAPGEFTTEDLESAVATRR